MNHSIEFLGQRTFICFIGLFRISIAVAITLVPCFSQIDPNPNSPEPKLMAVSDFCSTYQKDETLLNQTSDRICSDWTNSDLATNFILANVDFLKGEGANALRMYVETSQGQKYRFPVRELKPLTASSGHYWLTIQLKNDLNGESVSFRNSKISFRLSWRGLISNSVNIYFDKSGQSQILKSEVTGDFKNKPISDSDSSEFVGYKYSGDRLRFLKQATFGPTQESDQRLRRLGLRTWLGDQFTANYPSSSNPYPQLPLKPGVKDIGCPPFVPPEDKRICDRDYYSMYQVQNWFFKEALYGDAQLRHRIAWALSQLWVISGKTTQQASHMVAYHKVLSKNAFGNYRSLMREMTLNPGMGNYLDMARSHAFSPNENYAREILQLFTIGLFRLNQDGTLLLDSTGQPIPTYNQESVNNFTKIFTGWTFCNDGNNPACPNAIVGTVNFIDPMFLIPESHDPNPKTLLNYPNAVYQNIPAGQSGEQDLDQALDNIFYHPNIGPFVGRILIQHLVTSDPTPAYVGRVASAFNNNGFGVRGDMKSVISAILLDPEARGDIKTDPYYGKLQEPVSLMTNILRQFNVRSADGTLESDGVLAEQSKKMGQDPFNATTVFNYFSPGYFIPGTTTNAPEFGVMTTSTSISRANFANKFTFGKLLPQQDVPLGSSLDLNFLIEIVRADTSGISLVNELDRRFMHNSMSSQMREILFTGILAVPSNDPETRARNSFFLVASSSQFQIQR